jgi:hypothetical protein
LALLGPAWLGMVWFWLGLGGFEDIKFMWVNIGHKIGSKEVSWPFG